MKKLPIVHSLREAINEVIKNNKEEGYPPNRFIQAVSVKDEDLLRVCSKMVTSPDSLSALYDAISKHPNLLTIEDFIVVYGEKWGFSSEIIEECKKRGQLFDEIARKKRFSVYSE
jgi:hypothetical protein